jgi:hypothetical protein
MDKTLALEGHDGDDFFPCTVANPEVKAVVFITKAWRVISIFDNYAKRGLRRLRCLLRLR